MAGDGDNQISVGGAFQGQLVVGDNNVVVHSDGVTEVVVRHESMPAPRPRSRPAGTPLPFGEPDLLGRDDDLDRIRGLLDERMPVQVTGPSGVGRSALLRTVAARREAAGTDVVFLSAAGMDMDDVLQELFQACYDTRDYRPAQPQLRRLMGTINALVVVDDAGGDAADLAKLLDALPGCGLVVSTANRVPWDGETIALAGLPEDRAAELLVREIRRDCSADERRLAERFARSVDGHPAALVQAASALRSATVTDVPADREMLADALATGLGDTARAVLTTVRAAEGVAVPAPLVADLTEELGEDDAEDVLGRLADAGLVVREGSGYSLCGPLARSVTRDDPPTEPGRRAAVLAAWARSAGADEVAATGTLVVTVLETAYEEGHYAAARDLAKATAPALCLTLRWGAWRRVLALGRQASRALRAADDEAYFEQQEHLRRKALTKGALVGAAVGTALLTGKHLAGASSAKGGAATASKSLLAKPSVLGACATVVVGGTIAAMGLGWTPASSNGGLTSPTTRAGLPQTSLSSAPHDNGNGNGGNGNGSNGKNEEDKSQGQRQGNGGRGGSNCVAEQPKPHDFGTFKPRDDRYNPEWHSVWTFPVCDRRLDGPNWSIRGGEGHFRKAIDDTCGFGIILPGSRCLLGLTFDPGPVANMKYEATVVLPGLGLSGGSAAPQEIKLFGATGDADPAPASLSVTVTGPGEVEISRNGGTLGRCSQNSCTNLSGTKQGDRITLTPIGTASNPSTGQPTWPSPCPAGAPGDRPCEFVVTGDVSMTVKVD
ncbi:ATP-binding protein [Actinomadura macra]|uniref:ATP-binding protein n=1 Tax=Actinomadura macra TaxID=46164 RepID=UPI000833C8E9|nr:ATP-binding protein [Actinomadura macra]